MAKLDVGVGDEFPTEEIIRDEHGVVHHHHYYRRRRRPFGFLRVMLSIVLVMLVLRLFDHAEWMEWNLPWMPQGYAPFAATLLSIAVVGVLLYALRCRDLGDRPW